MTHNFWSIKLFLFLLPLTLLGQLKQNDLTQLSYDNIRQLYFDNIKTPAKQTIYANAFLDKAKKEKDNLQIARGYYLISLLYKEDKIVIKYLDSVIKYSKNHDDKYMPTTIYSQKAYILKRQFKYKEAIDNFILAEKYAIKNNINYYYNLRISIAVLKSENLGEVEEAMSLYQECLKYYKTKDTRSPDYAPTYLGLLFDIADAHKALQQTDSATYYNRLGYKEAMINKDQEMRYLFVLNEGANLVIKKKYKPALDSINKALPEMIALKNVVNTLAAYYYLGRIYEGLGKKDIAAINYNKVDSIYKVTNDITPEFVSGYQYLIAYYKNKGDKAKQLQTLTTYMVIDSTLQKNYKELNKKLQNEYDFPHLVKDKEVLIQSLQNNQSYYYWGLGTLFLLVAGTSFYGVYQRNLKKTYKTRFEKIINDTTTATNNTIVSKVVAPITIEADANNTKSSVIAAELVADILEKFDNFENKKGYLQPDVSSKSLSIDFETNIRYISKIINDYKGKSVVTYLNDLRIDNAVMSLKEDKDLKKYTIQVLAKEFGFNNAEAFALAFQKRTGLKPSFFIKELYKIDQIKN
jgi:AraC-like DNA-binding protein